MLNKITSLMENNIELYETFSFFDPRLKQQPIFELGIYSEIYPKILNYFNIFEKEVGDNRD